MLLDLRPVSRKTPLDGKLEISAAAAARLSALGAEFPLAALGRAGRGRLESMECTCAKAEGARHVHHFVVSPLLRALDAGAQVRVELDESDGALRIEPAS
jgi:hypothetical protein